MGKKRESETPEPPKLMSADELAALVEKRDRLSAEHAAASEAVERAIEFVAVGSYAAADGGVVCVYRPDRTSMYLYGTDIKLVKFTRPLRELKPA